MKKNKNKNNQRLWFRFGIFSLSLTSLLLLAFAIFTSLSAFATSLSLFSGMLTKEVIRPQVPLRPPCYDFSLVADPRFDSTN